MRIAACVLLLIPLAGCSVVPTAAWTFDPTRPPPKTALTAQELAALTDRVAQLQLQRNEIRSRIASQADVRQRQELYAQLHGIGMELSPLERRLGTVAAGR